MGTLLEGIPPDLDQAIVVAQHRAPESSRGVLESLLQRHVERPVTEPDDKELIEPGHVYVAPPDYHLLVDGGRFALSVEARVQYARPSIDVLFESVADGYRERAIGIVLTGANKDGAAGLAAIKRNGGVSIVQDPRRRAADDARSRDRGRRRRRGAAARGDRPVPLRVVLPVSEHARSSCSSTTGRRTCSRSRRSSIRSATELVRVNRARRRCAACSTTSTR